MFVCVFLCCVVLCRQRPCVGLIPRPRSPTKCLMTRHCRSLMLRAERKRNK
jgi:hypothetical protein